jgi:hypothetical protein
MNRHSHNHFPYLHVSVPSYILYSSSYSYEGYGGDNCSNQPLPYHPLAEDGDEE